MEKIRDTGRETERQRKSEMENLINNKIREIEKVRDGVTVN